MFGRFFCVSAGLQNRHRPVIKVYIKVQARGERVMHVYRHNLDLFIHSSIQTSCSWNVLTFIFEHSPI